MLVKQKNMNILHLTLKKQWFDMILSGEKKEEYRVLKPYWLNRLYYNDDKDLYANDYAEEVTTELGSFNYSDAELEMWSGWKKHNFDKIIFTNGYAKQAPRIEIECLGLEVREGKAEWGAEPEVKYFVLKLGDMIEPLVDHI